MSEDPDKKIVLVAKNFKIAVFAFFLLALREVEEYKSYQQSSLCLIAMFAKQNKN
jgi:hypothetical protein